MEEALLDRITADPAIFRGEPIIRGMRISVAPGSPTRTR
jgi:uncharacterized protein (DUF433 family)